MRYLCSFSFSLFWLVRGNGGCWCLKRFKRQKIMGPLLKYWSEEGGGGLCLGRKSSSWEGEFLPMVVPEQVPFVSLSGSSRSPQVHLGLRKDVFWQCRNLEVSPFCTSRFPLCTSKTLKAEAWGLPSDTEVGTQGLAGSRTPHSFLSGRQWKKGSALRSKMALPRACLRLSTDV